MVFADSTFAISDKDDGITDAFKRDGAKADGAEVLSFVYPVTPDPYYRDRDQYFIDVLKLALKKSGRPYTLSSEPVAAMNEKRSKVFLQSGRYNVHWLLTNRQFERELHPIRIPLFKGVIGWRLLVIRKEEQEKYARINSTKELSRLTAIQGLGWPDASILESQHFSLRLSSEWGGMLDLMGAGRADYMPLAMSDVWQVVDALENHNLQIEKHLVLRYPSAYYFFVNPKQKLHAEALRKGLRRAVEDGSFSKLFNKRFGDIIARSNLDQRQILDVQNPLLPELTPVNDEHLWFQPQG